MTTPSVLVTPAQLGTLLKDPTIDVARATDIIADATTLCASVVTLTPACSVVIKRVAARAYGSSVPRGPASPFGGQAASGPATGMAGVALWPSDLKDLRRLTGGTAAFDIDQLDDAYALPADLPYWDSSSPLPGDIGDTDGI